MLMFIRWPMLGMLVHGFGAVCCMMVQQSYELHLALKILVSIGFVINFMLFIIYQWIIYRLGELEDNRREQEHDKEPDR